MAGHYFKDPRAFYDITEDQKYSLLDDLFTPGKKDPPFIQSEYRVKEGKNNQKKKNEKGETDEQQEQKKKNEEKSKIQTVELNVNLCCDNCVRQVKQTLENVGGVEKVDCDQLNRKVWVKGIVKPEVVLKKVKRVRQDAELVEKKKQN